MCVYIYIYICIHPGPTSLGSRDGGDRSPATAAREQFLVINRSVIAI